MNIQRLKFAYARGARIQVPEGAVKWLGNPNSGPWTTVNMPFWSPNQRFRIHPDDAHLEYGPLSTALRDYAIQGSHAWRQQVWVALLAVKHYIDEEAYIFGCADNEHRALWLFYAELLADEGL